MDVLFWGIGGICVYLQKISDMKKEDINREYEYSGAAANGFVMICVEMLIPALLALAWMYCFDMSDVVVSLLGALTFVAGIAWLIILFGFFTQEPNVSRVMIFFGKYRGTFRGTGFFWVNPFMSRKQLSLRVRNMDIEPIKVNDKIGNPVMIGMVLVWKIKDTYRAVFDIDTPASATGSNINHSLEKFVRIQSDAALREVTTKFAYDSAGSHDHELTLRDGGDEINELLESKINERLAMAGMEVVEARLNYLAYAPEIAAVMLRRQQASAIIDAREKIVEGAVSMVEMAIVKLEEKNIVKFDEQSKARMVGNLLVVLCGDDPAQPVVNTSNG